LSDKNKKYFLVVAVVFSIDEITASIVEFRNKLIKSFFHLF